MMVMLPLRGVLAINYSICQMQDESSQEMIDHSKHMMSVETQVDVNESHDCCGDGDVKCHSDCGLGINISIIIQPVVTVPALNNTSFRTHVNNILVLRELTPPTRPPAYL